MFYCLSGTAILEALRVRFLCVNSTWDFTVIHLIILIGF
jgi:hypothetical protein